MYLNMFSWKIKKNIKSLGKKMTYLELCLTAGLSAQVKTPITDKVQ